MSEKKKVLYLDCGMGAAGDMLGAALYELLDDHDRKKYIEEINSAGIEGVTVEAHPDTKAGIAGTHMSVKIDGVEEGDHDHHDHHHEHHHDHHHDHDHDHGFEDDHDHEHHHDHDHDHGFEDDHHHDHDHHHHHHASLKDVHDMIEATSFSANVKADACAVYDLIAAAESRAHGKEVSEIHFHEVGMKDAVIDVLGACRLIEMISPDEIIASPIRTGFGDVKCAHGIVPVPAPATAYLLEGIPAYAGDIRGEMCTPTGAAILKHFAAKYCEMPAMITEAVGYGCGKKEFERANCVRAMIGTVSDSMANESGISNPNDQSEKKASSTGVVELSTNIDDMTGEALGFAAESMREEGALDVYFTPVYMKKNRPGYILTVLCRSEDEEKMSGLFFKHTSTWGIRRRDVERRYMDTRIEKRDTEFGPVRFKVGEGYGITKSKPEYEDIARIAAEKSLSVREVIERLN